MGTTSYLPCVSCLVRGQFNPLDGYSRSSTDPCDTDYMNIKYERVNIDDINVRDKRDHVDDEIDIAKGRDYGGVRDCYEEDAEEMDDENRQDILPPKLCPGL